MKPPHLTLLSLLIIAIAALSCTSADDALDKGNEFFDARQYEKAVEEYTKAIEIDPDDARPYLYRGVVRGITGDYEGAAADHQSVLNLPLLSPKDAASAHGQQLGSFTMWTLYLRSGDYDKAIADYETFTRLSPDEADAYMWRGCAHYLKGENEQAIADYDKALSINSGEPFTLFKRGLAYARLGNSSAARQDFTRALEIGFEAAAREGDSNNQGFPNALRTPSTHQQGIFHYNRAQERLRQADYNNAVADMDKARKLIDPQLIHLYSDDMHDVYYRSGIAYYDTGLYDDAISLFDKAIGVAASPSEYPAAYYWRGMSHYRKGSDRRAIADFDMVIHLERDFPDAAHYRRLSQEELSK